jgi:hypothetical protein
MLPSLSALYSIYIANPIVGTNFTTTLSTNYYAYQLRMVEFIYTCDANVANRTLKIVMKTSAGTVIATPNSAIVVTANNNSFCKFISGIINGVLPATSIVGQLPLYSMKPTDTISSLVTNIQDGDQLSAIHLLFSV